MLALLKRLASRLPRPWQQELKRLHFARLIRKGQFSADEPEFERLAEWVRRGDWVLDIGANVGQYTIRLSELVGASGRVIAFEPVPPTFELLAANVARARFANITLVNAAASDEPGLVGMAIPMLDTGLDNYYMASLTDNGGTVSVLAAPVDTLPLPQRISLAKVDVEGHELRVLRGMAAVLARDHPVLIVEGRSADVLGYLSQFGYRYTDAARSPNRVFALPVPADAMPDSATSSPRSAF